MPKNKLREDYAFLLNWRKVYYSDSTMKGTSNDGFQAEVSYMYYKKKWIGSIVKYKNMHPTKQIVSPGFSHLHDAAVWCEQIYQNPNELNIHKREVSEMHQFEKLLSEQKGKRNE